MFNELKVFTGFAITISDLPKNEKLTYLKVANNATTEAELRLIANKFISEVEVGKILKTAAIVATAILAGRQIYDMYFSKAAQKCKNEAVLDKRSCVDKAKIEALSQKYRALMRELPKCTEAHDVQKCKKRFSNEAEKIRDEILKIRTSIAKQ